MSDVLLKQKETKLTRHQWYTDTMPKLAEDTDKISPTLVKTIIERLRKLAQRYVDLSMDPEFDSQMRMAFLYTTRTGLMKTFGSPVLVRCIEENQLKFSEAPEWEDMDVMMEDDMEFVTLPKLDKKLEEFTTIELSNLVQSLLNEINGDKPLYWGNEKKRPDFWPKAVPFRKIWQEEGIDEEQRLRNLACVVEAMYSHHGYNLNTWVLESVRNTRMKTKQRKWNEGVDQLDRKKKSKNNLYKQLLDQVYKQIQKYNFIGRDAAEENIIPKLTITCIYTKRYGTLHAYGSAVTLSVVNAKQVEFMEHKLWEDPEQCYSEFIECIFLPRLKKKVGEFTIPELIKEITILLKDTTGKGQILWGNEDHKPQFWPANVPFVNPKSKPPEYHNMLEWKFALGNVLISLYEYYDYDPKIWTKEMEHSYSIPQRAEVCVNSEDKETVLGRSEACHVSILYKDEALILEPCSDCCEGTINNYHCPLCQVSRFAPGTKPKVEAHLDTHLNTQVTYKDFKMLRCHLNCTYSELQKGHFHCPFCNATRSRKDNIYSHVTSCHKEAMTDSEMQSCVDSPQEPEKEFRHFHVKVSDASSDKNEHKKSLKRQSVDKAKVASPIKKSKRDTDCSMAVTPTRASSRIMSRREAGKVPVWKDLIPRSTVEAPSKSTRVENTELSEPLSSKGSTTKLISDKTEINTPTQKGTGERAAENDKKLIIKASVEISMSELEKINASVDEVLLMLVEETGVSFMDQEGKILIQGDWQSICNAKQLLEKMAAKPEELQSMKRKSTVEQPNDEALKHVDNQREKETDENKKAEIVEVCADDTAKVENEEVTVFLPENYKQTLGKHGIISDKPAHGRCTFLRKPREVDHTCDICGFTTTETGLQKHKLRNHPEHFFLCEVCHKSFGVRYDMRLHRKRHFDDKGKLLPKDRILYRQKNPGKGWIPTLDKLEQSTVIVSPGGAAQDVQDWLVEKHNDPCKPQEEDGGNDDLEAQNVEPIDRNEEVENDGCVVESSELQNVDGDGVQENIDEIDEDGEESEDYEELEIKPFAGHSPSSHAGHPADAKQTIRKMERIGRASVQGKGSSLGKMKLGGSFLVKDPSRATEECGICGFKSSIKGLLKHRQRHHPEFTYQCHFCDRQFGVRNDLVRHMTKHTKEQWFCSEVDEEGAEKYFCRRCGFSSDTREDVEKHLQSEFSVKVNAATLKCEKCAFEGSEKEISDHMKVEHAGYACAMCRQVFEMSEERVEHVRKEHMDGKGEIIFPTKSGLARDTARFTCEICNRSLSVARFHTHMKSHEQKTFKCTECDFEADGRYKLKTHITLKHEWPKDCEICGVSLAYPVAMKLHMQSKHEDQKFACTICGKVFSERRYLTVHIQRVHNRRKSYTCDICGRGFFEKYRWKLHKETHLAEVSEEAADALKKIACSFCGKRFRTRAHVKQHENAHQGIRKYVCKICNRAFTWSAELNKHKVSHLKTKPYPCQLCNKVFGFKGALEAHMTMHTKQGKHRCLQCGKVYTARASLRRHRCKANKKRQEFYVQIQNPAEVPQDTVYEIQLESTEAVPAGVSEVQLIDQGSLSREEEEEEGVAYMCGVCRQLFNNASTVNEHIQTEHAGATADIQDEGEAVEMLSEQEGVEELVIVEADDSGQVVQIKPEGISLEGQQIIEMTPEEAAQLLGENLVSNIISATDAGSSETNVEEDQTEMVYFTTESVPGEEVAHDGIHLQEVAEQPVVHFLPMLTSEEQAVANTLADLAQ